MLPQQNGLTKNRITNLKVVDIEKRKDTKNLVFILDVRWSNGDVKTISRQYSMFFDLLGGLKLIFKDIPYVTIPDLPVPKFQVTMLFSSLAKKESRVVEDFCQKLIRLPPVITESDIVEKFFSVWGTDAVYSQDSTSKNPPISRPLSVDHRDDHVVEKYRAVASYQASTSGEMKLDENEIVTVIEKNQTGWWLVTNDKGQHGFAPATFLVPRDPSRQSECDDWMDYDGESRIWVAVLSYTAQSIDEISYNKGDELEVIATSSLGWWKVRLQGKIGITPASNLIAKSEQLSEDASVFENPIYDETPRSRRASFTNVGTIYASIRKPPPRRDSSRKKNMATDPSNALTLEYASISVANETFLLPCPPTFYDDTTIDDDPDYLYSIVVPKHLRRQPKITETQKPKIDEGIYDEVSEDIPPTVPICLVDETATLARQKDEQSAQGENQRPRSAEETNSRNDNTHGYLNAFHGDEKENRTSLYKAVTNYNPPPDRPEDLSLQEGCIVRALTKDGVFFFVSSFDDSTQQGWVPEHVLQNINKSNSAHRRSRSLGDLLIKESNQSEESRAIASKLLEFHNRTPVAAPRKEKRRYFSFDATNAPDEPLEHAQNDHHHGSQEISCELHSLKVSSLAETESWFHGKMNRQTCEEQMLRKAKELDFLIRESTQRFASYVLSVMFSKKVRHFPIETTPRKKFVIGKHAFDSLPDIVDFFTKHPLFYTQNREPVSLGEPFRHCSLKTS